MGRWRITTTSEIIYYLCLHEEEDAIEAVPHEEPQLHEDRIPSPVEIVPDRTRYPRRQHRPPEYYGALPY